MSGNPLTTGQVVETTLANLRHPKRYNLVWTALKEWTHLRHNRLPVAFLAHVWPDIGEAPVAVAVDIAHPFELPYGERTVLAAIAGRIRPAVVVEFGTYTGATTALLASAAPDAHIHTIDLPDEKLPGDVDAAGIGRFYRADPALRARITEHRIDSRDLRTDDMRGCVDLIFIDASHEYEDVLRDSRKALEMVSGRGAIVWDDYHPMLPDVVRALNELAEERRLVRIAHTRLVLYLPSWPEGVPLVNDMPWSML